MTDQKFLQQCARDEARRLQEHNDRVNAALRHAGGRISETKPASNVRDRVMEVEYEVTQVQSNNLSRN